MGLSEEDEIFLISIINNILSSVPFFLKKNINSNIINNIINNIPTNLKKYTLVEILDFIQDAIKKGKINL